MTSYNNLYQEFKKLKKGQEPTLTRTRKKSSKKKKKTTSKTSLLFSNQNHVTLTRTVSAPLITDNNTLHRVSFKTIICIFKDLLEYSNSKDILKTESVFVIFSSAVLTCSVSDNGQCQAVSDP